MKISVVVPVYNRENTIVQCLDSIVNQTYKPYEVIVVDDLSTDNTIELVEKYPSSLVKLIKCQEKAGAQAARNIGAKAAGGDWIAFQDSDDIWLPEKLEMQKDAIVKSGMEVCAGGGICQREDRREEIELEGKSGYIYKEILSLKIYIMYQTLLLKKSILEETGFLDEKVVAYQELDTAIRISKNNNIVYINQPLFIYNLDDNANISKSRTLGLEGIKYLYHKFREEILRTNGKMGLIPWYEKLAHNYGKKSWRYYIYLFKIKIYRLGFRS